MKEFIKGLPLIGKIFVAINRERFKFYKRLKNSKYDPPETWIEEFLRKEDATIIQVGSNNGVHGDPLFNLIKRNKKWKAIFIEPIPYLFEKLKLNYGSDPRFFFENVAINDGSKQVFYFVNPKAKENHADLPSWFDQLGSFNRDNILNHLDGILEPYIEEMNLNGSTLMALVEKHNIDNINLLHIDTEGYDWKVLSQLDLKTFYPELILYEHKHLNKKDKGRSLDFVKSKYKVFELGGDYICVNKELISGYNSPRPKGKRII